MSSTSLPFYTATRPDLLLLIEAEVEKAARKVTETVELDHPDRPGINPDNALGEFRDGIHALYCRMAKCTDKESQEGFDQIRTEAQQLAITYYQALGLECDPV